MATEKQAQGSKAMHAAGRCPLIIMIPRGSTDPSRALTLAQVSTTMVDPKDWAAVQATPGFARVKHLIKEGKPEGQPEGQPAS